MHDIKTKGVIFKTGKIVGDGGRNGKVQVVLEGEDNQPLECFLSRLWNISEVEREREEEEESSSEEEEE